MSAAVFSSALHMLLANARAEELRATAEAHRPRVAPDPPPEADTRSTVTLRFAFPDDELALARLAVLDSSAALAGPVLLAEVGGELWAALSLKDGRVIADPFRRTTALVELLRARAAQLDAPPARARRWRPGWIGLRHRASAG